MTDTPKRLKVVHVTLGLEVGGQERLLVEMARHRDASRFDWAVISLGTRGPLADALEAIGVGVVAMGSPEGFTPLLWSRLSSMFHVEHCDVVHTHDDRPLIYAMPAAWWAGTKRRIHTHHHGQLDQFTWRQRFLLRQAARFAQHFICVSHDSARYMVDQGVSRSIVQTIWNGIDLTRFAYQGPCDNGSVVTVARLSPEKDIATLLRAIPHVVAKMPQARFDIAGDGPCREELRGLARTLNIADQVTFHGTSHDIPAFLCRARLFVLPSLSEGISLTLLEAMARGLPVVATNVGGNPEVVDAGATGLLVPPGDAKALAESIVELLTDMARCQRMGATGRQRVENYFDICKMTARYETLYSEGMP